MTLREIKEITDVLIDEGQNRPSKYGFHLGDTIKFSPIQVEEILKEYFEMDIPCNKNGCSDSTRMACCGCQEYFEWEKKNEHLEPSQPESKIGHWIALGYYDDYGEECSYKCSECGDIDTYPDNYCSNCGAKMVKEGKK